MRWRRPAPTALPEIEPIPLVSRAQAFDDPAYQFEPEYVGSRALLYLRGPAAWFQSPGGWAVAELDALAWALRDQLDEETAILDGQVIGLDPEGKQDRSAAPGSGAQLHYAAFDLLWRRHTDFRQRPLWSRRRELEQLIPKATKLLSPVYAVPEQGRALLRAAERLHYQGIVAKRRTDPYRAGIVWYAIPTRGGGQPRRLSLDAGLPPGR